MRETTYSRQEMARIFKSPHNELTEAELEYRNKKLIPETWALYYLKMKGKGEPDMPLKNRIEAWFWRGIIMIVFGGLPSPPLLQVLLK